MHRCGAATRISHNAKLPLVGAARVPRRGAARLSAGATVGRRGRSALSSTAAHRRAGRTARGACAPPAVRARLGRRRARRLPLRSADRPQRLHGSERSVLGLDPGVGRRRLGRHVVGLSLLPHGRAAAGAAVARRQRDGVALRPTSCAASSARRAPRPSGWNDPGPGLLDLRHAAQDLGRPSRAASAQAQATDRAAVENEDSARGVRATAGARSRGGAGRRGARWSRSGPM
jgi:hypothetical protein